MTTMTQVYQALSSVLSALADVDQTSIDDFVPPIETQNTGLVVLPLGMESAFVPGDYAGNRVAQSHRIRCEFWIKDQGSVSATFGKARQIATDAVALLWADPTLGGAVADLRFFDGGSSDRTIRAEVPDVLVEVGNAAFLPVTLIVPIYLTELS